MAKTRRARLIQVGIGLVGFLGMLTVGAPAHAASAGCDVGLFGSSCQTGSISANASGHYIDWSAMGGAAPCLSANIHVYSASGQSVFYRHIGSGSASGRITGL